MNRIQQLTTWSRDYGHYLLGFWKEHTLSEGLDEFSDAVEDSLVGESNWLKASAGAAIGLAGLFGNIPLDIRDWVLQTTKEIPKGPGQTLYRFLEVPIQGMFHSAAYISSSFQQWSKGSLANENSLAIAKEVTTVLGAVVFLASGARSAAKGGGKFVGGLTSIEINFPQRAMATASVGINTGLLLQGGSEIMGGLVLLSSANKVEDTTPVRKRFYHTRLGETVRTYRTKRGLTQKQLAQETGMVPSTLGNLERGRTSAGKQLGKLEKVLKLEEGILRKIWIEEELAHRKSHQGPYSRLASAITRARLLRGLRSTELAQEVKMKADTLQAMERAEIPGRKYLEGLQRALKLEDGSLVQALIEDELAAKQKSGSRYPHLAARLTALRIQKGWTRKECARRAGVPTVTYQRTEQGQIPGVKYLPEITRAFGLELGSLQAELLKDR